MQDKELIDRVLEGDDKAFRTLYHRYKEAAWRLALYVCRDEVLAKDVLQNSFTSVYRYLGTFRYQSSLKTWVLKIVHNESVSQVKKEQKWEWTSLQEEIPEWQEYTLNIDDDLSRKETKQWIESILKEMKVKESFVLRLFYLEELSVKEVADIVNSKEGTVKVILHRARKNFKNRVENSILVSK